MNSHNILNNDFKIIMEKLHQARQTLSRID